MAVSRAAESRRGYAVIIINENPVDSAEFPVRKGADQDDLNIQKAFCTNLGFEWLNQRQYKDLRKSNVFHDDLCVNDPCDCLSCKIQATDHTESECFLLIISTHGREVNKKHVLTFSDDKKVSVPKLIDMLSDKKCPSLQGKPRILILQACRTNHDLPEGIRDDHGVHVNVSDATPLEKRMKSMTMNDEDINANDEDDADPYGQSETNTNCTSDSLRPDLGINKRASEDTEGIDRRSESNRTNLQNSTTSSDAQSECQNVVDVISSGEESDSDVVDDDHVDFEGSGIPEQFIIVYPSASGKKAKRNNMYGSWLIMELCKEICKHMEAPQYRMNPEVNFMKILTNTTGSVAKKETKVYMKDSKGKLTPQLDEKRSGLKNAVCTIHRLIKPLVFRPLIKPIEPQLDKPAV